MTNCNDADGSENEHTEDQEENELASSEGKPISVKLFIRKLKQIGAYEAANNPKETKKVILSFLLGDRYTRSKRCQCLKYDRTID